MAIQSPAAAPRDMPLSESARTGQLRRKTKTNAMTNGMSAPAILPSPQNATATRMSPPMVVHTTSALWRQRRYRASGVVTGSSLPHDVLSQDAQGATQQA